MNTFLTTSKSIDIDDLEKFDIEIQGDEMKIYHFANGEIVDSVHVPLNVAQQIVKMFNAHIDASMKMGDQS